MTKASREPLTIEQRVDLLLEHGVDHPEKWIAVDAYDEPSKYDLYDDDGCFNEVYYNDLLEHHRVETTFLFDVVRELDRRLTALDEQFANAIVCGSAEDD